MPVAVRDVASSVRAMPKSTRRGPCGGDHHVGGLEVPVHHTHGMDGDQRFREPGGQPVQPVAAERPFDAYVLVQRAPGDVLRRQPRPPGLDVGREYPYTAGALDAAEHRHLAPEPYPELLVRGMHVVDQLDRGPPAGGVDTRVDDPHAAGPEPSDDPVRPHLRRIPLLRRGDVQGVGGLGPPWPGQWRRRPVRLGAGPVGGRLPARRDGPAGGRIEGPMGAGRGGIRKRSSRFDSLTRSRGSISERRSTRATCIISPNIPISPASSRTEPPGDRPRALISAPMSSPSRDGDAGAGRRGEERRLLVEVGPTEHLGLYVSSIHRGPNFMCRP